MRFRVRVSRKKARANHFVIFASFASQVFALVLLIKPSDAPEIEPEIPELLAGWNMTIRESAKPARS